MEGKKVNEMDAGELREYIITHYEDAICGRTSLEFHEQVRFNCLVYRCARLAGISVDVVFGDLVDDICGTDEDV